MAKNYSYAYQNLIKQFSDIQEQLEQTRGLPAELQNAKDTICAFTFPPSITQDILIQLAVNKNVISTAARDFTDYITAHDDGDRLIEPLLGIKLAKILIERYAIDLNFIIRGVKMDCFERDCLDMLHVTHNGINDLDDEGDTLLMKATANGSNQIIDKLLKLGADPFVSDSHGNTAFSIALKLGDLIHAKQFMKTKISDQVLLEHIESLSTIDFESYIASNICKTASPLRDALELDERKALACFSESSDYCYKILGDEVDFSKANELF